jgi:hypothetical protein
VCTFYQTRLAHICNRTRCRSLTVSVFHHVRLVSWDFFVYTRSIIPHEMSKESEIIKRDQVASLRRKAFIAKRILKG